MPDRLEILYCTDTLMAGGAERQLVELVTRLDRERFNPSVICLHSQRKGCSLHFAPTLEAAGVPLEVFDLIWTPVDLLRTMRRLIAAVWHSRPDILHAINHHSNHVARLSRVFLPPSLKLIASIRTDYTLRQLRYERLEQWACNVVVCNSPSMQRKLREVSHLPARKLLFIPNGVDLARFRTPPESDPRTSLAPGADQVVAMPARISRQKSPHLLAEAVGLLKQRGDLPPGTRVLIVGEQEDPAFQVLLDSTIHRYGLAEIVLQFSQTAAPERFYHAADVVSLATLWEGMPNVALEALAAGRPVIISEAANAAQIIEDGVTGWVVRTQDVEHLAETLRLALSRSPSQTQAMSAACQRRAEDFSMDRMVERYQALYDRLRATPTPKS